MCYHPFWLGQYYNKNARVLRAPLIQLKYTLKHWKSTFSYYCYFICSENGWVEQDIFLEWL